MRPVFLAILALFPISAVYAQVPLTVTPGKVSGGVGICILISDHGTVEKAKVVESSGDKLKDETALDFAATMRWPNRPYPPAGWRGIRIADDPNDKTPEPTCDPDKL